MHLVEGVGKIVDFGLKLCFRAGLVLLRSKDLGSEVPVLATALIIRLHQVSQQYCSKHLKGTNIQTLPMQQFVSPNNHLGGRELVAAIISSSDEKHLRRFWSFDDFFEPLSFT